MTTEYAWFIGYASHDRDGFLVMATRDERKPQWEGPFRNQDAARKAMNANRQKRMAQVIADNLRYGRTSA